MARSESLADQARTVFQPFERMLQGTLTCCRGSDYQRAVRYCVGYALIFLCIREHCRRANCGPRLTKRRVIWRHYSQVTESEVAHGASRRANVEGVARSHQDDT